MRQIDHPFQDLSHNFVASTGPTPCRVLMIGESPGAEEDEVGRCFVGKTGREMDRFYLPLIGLRRSEVRVANLIPVHPVLNRNPTTDEIKFFEYLIYEEIESCKPEIIVPMGAFAVKWFLGGHVDLHTVHGIPHTSKRSPGAIILPSYHPAAGLHDLDNQPLIVYDFQQIQAALLGTLPERAVDTFENPAYTELLTAEDVYGSLQGCAPDFMGLDTEGYSGNPWGLSYSISTGVAYVIRSQSADALRAFSEWIGAHPSTVIVFHASLHDLPILREMGIHVVNFEDTMVYAYCLALEPQGLKDLSYRHCGMRMKSYEDVTGPAMRKLTAEYLIKVASGDWGLDPKVPIRESDKTIKYRQPQALHKRATAAINDIFGAWSGTIIGNKRGGSAGLKKIGVRVGKVDKSADSLPKNINAWFCNIPIPVKPRLDDLYGDYIPNLRDGLIDLRSPVPPTVENRPDPVKRWTAILEDLEESVARCEAVIGALPKTGLDAIEDQQIAINYSGRDADSTLRIRHKIHTKIAANGLSNLAEMDMSVLPYLDRMGSVGIKVNRKHMLDYGDKLKIEMRVIQEKLEHDLGIWINPASPQQVAMIIYDILGFPVDVRTETGQPSTKDEVLEAMAPLHQNITDITDFRELYKLVSTYCVQLPKWTDAKSRCHPTWKYTRVASGRLSTSDPNLLGIPVRSARGNLIRAGFLPEPGRAFVGCDLSQIEVRVAAHISRDPNLIKIFQDAAIDFHTRTAAYMWRTTDEEIIKDHKELGGSSKRSSGKNCSFGILYGIGAKGLQSQLKSKCHTDWTIEQCQEMLDLWLEKAYPRVKWYMERQKHFCRTNGYVESLCGRRRYLPGVHSTIPRIREEAYRAAINHPIQASSAEILKIAERNIWERVLPAFWESGASVEPVLAIHDELIFETDASVSEDLMAAVIYEMESAVDLCVPIVSEGHISSESWACLK